MVILIRNAYKSFLPLSGRRGYLAWARLALSVVVAILATTFAASTAPKIYGQIATAITVLTGFTFTALFSDFALGQANLPKAETEHERLELIRLGRLSENFQVRVKLFIPLAIVEIVLLAGCGLFERSNGSVVAWPEWLLVMLVFFLFLESLYVFYRMAETIIVIVDLKRKYLSRRLLPDEMTPG